MMNIDLSDDESDFKIPPACKEFILGKVKDLVILTEKGLVNLRKVNDVKKMLALFDSNNLNASKGFHTSVKTWNVSSIETAKLTAFNAKKTALEEKTKLLDRERLQLFIESADLVNSSYTNQAANTKTNFTNEILALCDELYSADTLRSAKKAFKKFFTTSLDSKILEMRAQLLLDNKKKQEQDAQRNQDAEMADIADNLSRPERLGTFVDNRVDKLIDKKLAKLNLTRSRSKSPAKAARAASPKRSNSVSSNQSGHSKSSVKSDKSNHSQNKKNVKFEQKKANKNGQQGRLPRKKPG